MQNQPQNTSLNDSFASLEKALESKADQTIHTRNPVTLSYFDLQRLVYLQTQSPITKVQFHLPYRSDSGVQDLFQKIAKATSSGASISSLTIHANLSYTENTNSNTGLILDIIDLVLYLSSKNISSVQGFGDQPTQAKSSRFTLISGTFVSKGSFSIHIEAQPTGKASTFVQAVLNTGEILHTSIAPQDNVKAESNESMQGSLVDAAKALRVYFCAANSRETGSRVTIKHVSDEIVAVRAMGTAKFLRNGLFLPLSTGSNMAITGLYSSKTDRVREICNERIPEGEPFEYLPSYEVALSNAFNSNSWRPIIYIPSLPGLRKNKEILDALNSGYVVLAEKPAFPNADSAKAFLANLNKEHQKRLFFGWHYQHHYVFRRLLEDIDKNTFGKIKHVRTYFAAPKILSGVRIFDPAHGGAGLDIHSYNLHYTLRLIGFNHSFEVVQSKIENASALDVSKSELTKIDFILDTKLKFSNGTTADLYATFDSKTVLHTEAEVLFEDGTKILCKEFCHPQMMTRERANPVLIFRAGGTRWENYLNDQDLKNPEYWKTSYERQLDFIRRQATGEGKYDVVNNDADGLGLDANIKLNEIIDAILVAGGFEVKTGA